VNWQESHKFLKVEFPLNVHSLAATYETQFGHVERPTHMNTSWDMARFEVCGHRWADLSEYGFGVALLNDSKYGYATFGSVMRLSLLRSPKAPDANADMGEHDFTYSLFPHAGSFQDAGVIREASDLNDSLIVVPNPAGQAAFSMPSPFIQVTGGHGGVAIEAIKLDDATASSLVVRMCERFGGSCTACLTSLLPVKRAEIVDVLEAPLPAAAACTWASDGVQIAFTPFQLITVKLHF
jgi:alpha-mannosidase